MHFYSWLFVKVDGLRDVKYNGFYIMNFGGAGKKNAVLKNRPPQGKSLCAYLYIT